ncbi:aminotransferase class I/II-fold pyridoxal phosphate-dependent enzyme [Oscillospiraceae bacterium PP1C4]
MSGFLHNAVQAYLEKDRARFHMPGHKGQGEGAFASMLPYDITEVEGADSLFHADGAILELELELARIYGAKRSLLCAGGATLCIQTMLGLACGIGKKVIMSRNIHRAAINAMALLDLTPVWIYPEKDAGEWFLGRYTPESVKAALTEHPDVAGVYITSPDYFGVISDFEGIAQVCSAFHLPLLVDNAHGAHLKFIPERYGKLHPIDCGAAICCDSLHKTMPAMTGGAALHISDERYIADAKRMMSMFGSTSPSYPIMLSCETALEYAQDGAAQGFAETASRLDRIRLLALQKGFALPKGPSDPARLSLGFGALGLSAQTFGAHLRRYAVEPEYISATACVLMANGFNGAEDYTRLEAAIAVLSPSGSSAAPRLDTMPRPKQAMSVREAAFSTQESILVENSLGCIAAGEVSPCPPGIPIVMSGERIDEQTIETLKDCGIMQINIVKETMLEAEK